LRFADIDTAGYRRGLFEWLATQNKTACVIEPTLLLFEWKDVVRNPAREHGRVSCTDTDIGGRDRKFTMV
jgi:hypothetical protein